ncbi:hypothetical protein [Streptomyces sp. NPDC088923]|uniref:hypothetical protein n=1 Tax=Streptomyces sp. NPDC088923 TaxID=3365913 RepID=UPI003804DD83
MTPPRDVYVIDTGPLSAFAEAQYLGVLKTLLSEYEVLIPDVVAEEMREGLAQRPHLHAVLDAEWISTVDLVTPEQLRAFAFYTGHLLGPDGKNKGECGVLALAETSPSNTTALVDDRVALNLARSRRIPVRRTLGLLCEAIHEGLLTMPLVSAMADDLNRKHYRFPFGVGGFADWAKSAGAL